MLILSIKNTLKKVFAKKKETLTKSDETKKKNFQSFSVETNNGKYISPNVKSETKATKLFYINYTSRWVYHKYHKSSNYQTKKWIYSNMSTSSNTMTKPYGFQISSMFSSSFLFYMRVVFVLCINSMFIQLELVTGDVLIMIFGTLVLIVVFINLFQWVVWIVHNLCVARVGKCLSCGSSVVC